MKIDLTDTQAELLVLLSQRRDTPITRFELRKAGEDACISTALNHVWLLSEKDEMDEVKARGSVLADLEDRGLISIEYGLEVTVKADYEIYTKSKLYAKLCAIVEEGKAQPDFLFDTPYLMRGRVRLTAAGMMLCGGEPY